jgi:hypothetical protein
VRTAPQDVRVVVTAGVRQRLAILGSAPGVPEHDPIALRGRQCVRAGNEHPGCARELVEECPGSHVPYRGRSARKASGGQQGAIVADGRERDVAVAQLESQRGADRVWPVDVTAIPQNDLPGSARRAHRRQEGRVGGVSADEEPEPCLPFRAHGCARTPARGDVPDVDGTPAAADHEVAAVAAEDRHLGGRVPALEGAHLDQRRPLGHPHVAVSAWQRDKASGRVDGGVDGG